MGCLGWSACLSRSPPNLAMQEQPACETGSGVVSFIISCSKTLGSITVTAMALLQWLSRIWPRLAYWPEYPRLAYGLDWHTGPNTLGCAVSLSRIRPTAISHLFSLPVSATASLPTCGSVHACAHAWRSVARRRAARRRVASRRVYASMELSFVGGSSRRLSLWECCGY